MRKLFLIIMTLVACSWAAMAQTTYRGTVVDAENNEPLIGATIMPIGGGQGTATDIDGKYSISVPKNVTTAKVTYVGYQEQVVKLTNNMTIKLVSTEQNLQDVVVVAYGTATKESLTGSVAVVGAQEIEDRPVTSVTAALEGNAPGVQVNNSTSRPGESPSIRIRGFNSFTSTAQSPLYVVDGIVYDGEIADINPADIESMSVLKDAASCALYGNRGANGVILITTKRAKNSGHVDVTLQIRQGMYNRGLPFYDTLGPDQWMETSLLGYARGQVTAGSYSNLPEAIAEIAPNFINSYAMVNIYDREDSELFSPEGKLLGNVLPGYTDLKWWDAISRNGYRQEYNINATGATDKFNVFASAGYLKENGYMLKTDYERFNGRISANYQPVSYFKMGMNLAASYYESGVGPVDGDNMDSVSNPFLTDYYAPIQSYYAHNEDGSILYGENGQPVWNTGGLNQGNNVAWTMRLDDNNWKSNAIYATLFGTAVIPYGFELTVKGSMMRTKQTGMDYMNNVIGSQAGVGNLTVTNQSIFSHTFMQTLTWSHDYGDHHVDALLDHENYQYGYDVQVLNKKNQLLPDRITIGNFEDDVRSYDSSVLLRTESYLGRARYNYDQKYFGEFSLRRDGTSRFAKDCRWGTFWSVGASWIITKEKFMESTQNWLNYLKLRAAYGSVGNDAAASAYSYWSLYGQGTYDKKAIFLPTQLAALDLKWEATKTLDVAIEGSLFDDRFTFGIGYYDKRNADLLFNVVQPSSAGTNFSNSGYNPSVMMNIGTMSNRGWELQFGVDIIRNANLLWNFSVDATFNKNKILSLPDGKDRPGQSLFIGKSMYEKYDHVWAGVDMVTGNSLYEMNPDSPDFWAYMEDGVTLDAAATNANYQAKVDEAKSAGHYYELNGVAYTDRTQYAGRKILGTALPTVYGSFGTNLRWKGINLGLLFTYSLGGKSTNGNYKSLMSFGLNPSALHKDILNAWTEADAITGYDEAGAPIYAAHEVLEDGTILLSQGDINPDGVPVINNELSTYNDASSSRWNVSNSYLVFKNLNISYDFPSNWVSALKMAGLNLGFSVDNLFIASRQKGFNPQYSFSGGQGAYYVPSRVFSFQLTAKF